MGYKILKKVSDIEKDMWQDGFQDCPDPSSCLGESQDSCHCSCPGYNHTLKDP